MIQNRVDVVMDKMKNMQIPQLMVTDPLSIYYLTGYYNIPFERFFGLLLREDGEHVMFLNRLFYLDMDPGVKQVWFSDTDPVMDIVGKYLMPGMRLGVDKNMAARFLVPLLNQQKVSAVEVGSVCVDEARSHKDEEEQAIMIEASRVNDAAMNEMIQLLHTGVTEKEVADQLLGIYQSMGASGHAFHPIVAFGLNAADNHHMPDDTPLEEGMCVLLDVGCVKNRYCSDMTRTFFWKSVSERDRKVYEVVKRACNTAIEAVRPGVRLCDLDRIARDIITDAGYGETFNHRLGHFIGQEDHEYGDVSSANTNICEPGMVFSIEPGIYLRGEMGVRIEDLVLVTEDGYRNLNSYSKELTVL